MPRYDEVWGLLAERATAQGVLNVETFTQLLAGSGVSEERMLAMLEEDLANDGPLFGAFRRSLSFAASSTAMAAVRQGEAIGALAGDAELKHLTALAGMEGSVLEALDTADPELAAELEANVLDDIEHTWICTLRNTCHRCLPLHGKTLTLRLWKERGLLPELIHQGWDSDCHCRLMPAAIAGGRADLVAPLKRAKVPGSKRTVRALAQKDLDAALAAQAAALETEEGRAVLRLLGQVLDEED